MSTMTFYPPYLLCVCLGILCVTFVSYWNAVWRGGFAWDGSGKQFNWHPVLMVTGLVVLYGNGEWNEIKTHCCTLPQGCLSLPLPSLFISHAFFGDLPTTTNHTSLVIVALLCSHCPMIKHFSCLVLLVNLCSGCGVSCTSDLGTEQDPVEAAACWDAALGFGPVNFGTLCRVW